MSSASSPVSKADLPPELERMIFEQCYFTNPISLPTLLLICKRVFEWLNEIRCYYVRLHLEEEIERFQRWMETQSQESVRQKVKGILIDLPEPQLYPTLKSVVSACTGVESLGIWLYDSHSANIPPDELMRALLTMLPNVKHLSLNTDRHLRWMIGTGPYTAIPMNKVAFRKSLVSIDLGWCPSLPLGTFPDVSYAIIQPIGPLKAEKMTEMGDWISRPSSKALILLVETVDWETSPLPLPVPEEHILCNNNVVLLITTDVWSNDWYNHVFMNGKDFLGIGKRLVGLQQVEDRVFAVNSADEESSN
ncbi:hypothetical protein DL96DRAFT_1811918 [Flagelloscypha sp. PMI_526]|nr:hypothetical protein DL96DRAFT_1811918 [Flagelloscypha sp. PMI_526]